MEPDELKLICLKTVIPTCQCIKTDCNEPPVAFLMLNDEFQACCRKHYEISTFYHDGFDCYHTAENSETRYTVYIGLETLYLYTHPGLHPVNRYNNVHKVILGRSAEREDNVDCILVELRKGFYLLIADYLCVFETEDEILTLRSYYIGPGRICCFAIGKENVFNFPYYDPGSHYVTEKRSYPRETDWEKPVMFQSFDVLLNRRPLNSTLVKHNYRV